MKAVHLIRNSLLTGVCVGLMTGCSWLEDWPPKGSEMARKTAPKPPEASKPVESAENKWIKDGEQEVAAAAGTVEPMGLNVDPASADRISKLESSVEQISNDLKLMMPALTKLAEAQGNMQKTLNTVEPSSGGAMAQGNEPPAAPTSLAPQNAAPQPGTVAWYEEQERKKRQAQQPAPAPMQQQPYQPPPQQQNYQPPPQQAYQPPPQQGYHQPAYQQGGYQPPPPQQNYQQASYGSGYGGAAVTNVRFGEHPGKTRMVLDANGKVAFSHNVDNRENIIMINLPGTGWMGMPQMMVNNSPLVSSYNVIPDNQGGQQMIIQLKRPAQVLWSQALDPTGGQGHRIVFDIAPL